MMQVIMALLQVRSPETNAMLAIADASARIEVSQPHGRIEAFLRFLTMPQLGPARDQEVCVAIQARLR
jgi:hypothetical protein